MAPRESARDVITVNLIAPFLRPLHWPDVNPYQPPNSDRCSRHLPHVVFVLFCARHPSEEESNLDLLNV
jgi:hypothetical protein